jgi:hypothetical protein
MKKVKDQRTLSDIETDLNYALQHKTSGMLHIGRLLNEAKPLVDHGKWLPWLRRYTALSKSSAENYMKAASWVDSKFPTVGNLASAYLDYLSPGAIYALASGKFSAEVVERVLDAATAQTRHINEADVKEIARAGNQAAILKEIAADQKAEDEDEAEREAELEAEQVEWEAAQQAEKAKVEQERAEAEAILDGGPDPDLPPPPEPVAVSSETFHVATLERAVDALRSVMTKPLSTFASAKIPPDDIEQITAFLQEVAKQIAEKRRAA